MIGPLCESGQVFHKKSMVSPALTLAYRRPAVALLWQFTSAVPMAAGSTKPMSWFRASQPAVWGRLLAGEYHQTGSEPFVHAPLALMPVTKPWAETVGRRTAATLRREGVCMV